MARLVKPQRPAGMKVVVVRLLRVSRLMERQEGDPAFHSPGLQLAGIDAECDSVFGRNNWELADVEGNYGQATWADFDVSGGTMDREGLNAAIEALAIAGVHALGVYNISRWGRTVADGLKRIEELQAAGAQLISAKEPTNMFSPEGNFMVTMFLALGELQRHQAGAQWAAVIERRAEKQGRHHGVPPFGMCRPINRLTQKASGDIEPDPEKGPVLIEAFEQIADGKTRWAVGHWMVEAGYLARWEYLPDILTNRTYLRLHGPECIGTICARTDAHGPHGEVRSFDYEARGKKRVRRDAVWYPGTHEGLIDIELWYKVANRVEALNLAQAAKGQRTRRPVHELSGVCRCRHCTKALWLGKVRGKLVLRDPSMHRTGCQGIGVPSANAVLKVVLNDLELLVASIDADGMRKISNSPRKSKTEVKRPNLAAVRRQRKGVEDRITDVEVEQAMGVYQGNAEATLNALRKKLVEIIHQESLAQVPPEPVKIPSSVIDFLLDYQSMSIDQRNEWFREHCTVIISDRPEDAPWRMPYEDRVKVRWAWDPS